MNLNQLFFTLAFFVMGNIAIAQIVNNQTELNNAIAAASPGTTIILADGTWNDVFIDINKNGTSAAPIKITAQNIGAVLMTGNSRVLMEGSYLTISGLVFQNPANLVNNGTTIEPVFKLNECDSCRVINNKIDNYNGTESQKTMKFKWIYIDDCEHNEIAYNSFIGKYGIGSIINDNRGLSNADYLKIHHNYFADRAPINGVTDDNDQDAIRIGTSTTSLSNSFSEVYDNYFYNFFGEIEVISNKSGENKYYNNTFRKYSGCLTLRHGDNCEVYGNYFFAENNSFSGGVRVIGEGHKVYNNYIEGINSFKPNGASSSVTGGINVMNGATNSPLNGYYQVKNAQIVNNTFVNCDYALRVGTVINNNSEEPINLTVANNIMYNTSNTAYQVTTTPSGTSISQGNLTNLATGELVDDGNFHRITSGSTPINAAMGNYAFLAQDILGGNRSVIFDAGAEEFGSNGVNFPYDSADVGVIVGFGSAIVSTPTLTTSPSTLNFSLDSGSTTFDIIANVDWTITENISWLDLDVTSGSGTTTVTATVLENTTGNTRTGEIFIDEIVGGSDLKDTLSIVQLNTFVAEEIPIIATTSLGMQDKPEIMEINAYDDDFTTYWTGNPDTAAEVSITFDIACSQELSAIGINFWKADERTTTFSIAVSDQPFGPFTTIINADTSTTVNATVETEQLFSLAGVTARYIKFIGLGNSSSSNWASIANVNIYGNFDCDITNTFEPQLVDYKITLFPVPTTNGILNVVSDKKELKVIEIYNISGQKVLTTHGNRTYSKQIDVSALHSGVYFVRLEGIGMSKFIVK
ncbi:MAG: chondroitinase-B domain-containing protein [Saprospiraceae bacterium]